MGLCGSSLSSGEKAEIVTSKKLEEANARDFHREQEKVRLLLLGAGESGKSTVFKQMKILYGAGFSQEEIDWWKSAVFANTIEAMQNLCQAAMACGLQSQVQCKEEFAAMIDLPSNMPITHTEARIVKTLWADPAIQEIWDRRSEIQVIDSCHIFFDKIDAIAQPNYRPSKDDILLSRVRTSGIVEEAYVINDVPFVIIDVGGQRNERKKWVHCFDSVNAVIFVAALSEYDQVLFEANTQNRMVEALTLFEETCNSRWFQEKDMILFLNKRDLFLQKIKRVPIVSVPEFSDFAGDQANYAQGVRYFLEKFVNQNKCRRDIYHHVTCATDTDNVRVVFEACRQIILKQNLAASGLLS